MEYKMIIWQYIKFYIVQWIITEIDIQFEHEYKIKVVASMPELEISLMDFNFLP